VLSSIAAGAVLYRYVESQPEVIGLNLKTALLTCALIVTVLLDGVLW
jgi:hypothetical protein